MEKFTDLVKLFLRWQNSENDKKGLVELADEWDLADSFEKIDVEADDNFESDKIPMVDQQQQMKTNLLQSLPPSLLGGTLPPGIPIGKGIICNCIKIIKINLVPSPLLAINTKMAIQNLSMPDGMFFDKPNTMDVPCHNKKLKLMGAKEFLDHLARKFKFSVAYSDFPKVIDTFTYKIKLF